MTTAVRGTKAGGGGTNFSPATTILNDEVDADFNGIVSVINGNLDNANLISSADVSQTKIADHGTLTAQTTPGTPESPAVPSTLAADIEMLRFALGAAKFGKAANATDLPSDQGGELEWFERSPNWISGANNFVKNASFASFQAPASTTVPDDWSAVGPATTYDHTALVAGDGLELGHYLKITGAGAGTGVSQAFTASVLRPSTTYQFLCMAWATAGNTAHVTIGTGGGTDLDISTTSTTPQLMQGFFVTSAAPATVTLSLLSTGAGDISNWYAARIVPMTFIPRRQGHAFVLQRMDTVPAATITDTDTMGVNDTTVGAGDDGTTWTDLTTTLDRRIAVPGPGFNIRVTANVSGDFSINNAIWIVRLLETTDNGTNWIIRDGRALLCASSGVPIQPLAQSLFFLRAATPGLVYRYRVTTSTSAGTVLPQGVISPTSGHTKSFLCLELIPAGE